MDTKSLAQPRAANHQQKLLSAAASAMRWLQDRQAHVPLEQLDPREGRVLRQLRTAVRGAMDERR